MNTEEQARKKWCPFARVFATVGVQGEHETLAPAAYNRRHVVESGTEHTLSNPSETRCIASDCMAWRWDFPGYEEERTPDGAPHDWEPEGEGWHQQTALHWRRLKKPTTGYCGLAEPTECHGGCNYP